MTVPAAAVVVATATAVAAVAAAATEPESLLGLAAQAETAHPRRTIPLPVVAAREETMPLVVLAAL